MSEVTSDAGEGTDPDEFEIPEPLPAALGPLKHTVTWWNDSHGVTDPALAPAAIIGQTFTLEVIDDPASTPVAAALCGLLTNADAATLTPSTVLPTGELDHAAWMRECAAIRDHISVLRPLRSDPPALKAVLPPALQALVDRLAHHNGGCVVIDGPIPAACLLLAYELNPACLVRIRPLQRGQTPVEFAAVDYLRIEPVLPLETGYASGQLVEVAAKLINLSLELSSQR